MPIQATRALLDAVLSGELGGVEFRTDPVFGFEVPVAAPGVDEALLDPRSTWADPEAYDRKARELAQMFAENFATKHADAPAEVAAAAPKPWEGHLPARVDVQDRALPQEWVTLRRFAPCVSLTKTW